MKNGTTVIVPKGDLSTVWQAADDVCEWLNYEVSERSPGLLKSIESLNEAMGRAEISAGRGVKTAAARKPDEHERKAFAQYLSECEQCAIVPDLAGAFHWVWMRTATLASPSSGGCKEPPAPDQYRHFMTAYYKACQSSQPTDWLDAALMAKQWEQAITGGAFDAQYPAPKSGDKSHE